MKSGKEVLVLPTTHWDRAWYWPFQRFRVRLIAMMQAVLALSREHRAYTFVMDGQAIPLEDYLEACPEDLPQIQRLLKSGRMEAGPMFTLPDHYCTGGEALIRNFVIGEAIVRELGGEPPKILYLPDSFGFPADLPTLAAGAGYGAVSFMRGTDGNVPHDIRMFVWEGADGSAVRVFRLRDGYGNAAWIGKANPGFIRWTYDHEKAVERLIAAATKQDDPQGAPRVLLAGIDHMIPQPHLHSAMHDAGAASDFHFRYATLKDVVAKLDSCDSSSWLRYRGEFRGSGCAHILGGTVSARIHLKQANAAIERELVHCAEPADALCMLLSRPDPAGGALRAAWKHLLKTHPHDDITGCSVDKVHEDDEYHMGEAKEAADAVRRRMSLVLQHHYGGLPMGDTRYGFMLVNNQPFRRMCRARIVLDCEGRERWGDSPPPPCYAVVDEEGREIPFVELRRGRSEEHPHQFVEIELAAELPPFVPARFFLEPRDAWPLTPAGDGALDNGLVRAEIRDDGSFDLTDLETGRVLKRAGLFSDQADCGDAYDFSDIPGDAERVFEGVPFACRTLLACSGCQSVELSGSLPVPADSGRNGRSAEVAGLPVLVRLTLFPEEREVRAEITLVNTAKNHRLRWNIELPFKAEATRAGQKFCEVRHPVRPQPEAPAMAATAADGAFDAAAMGHPLKSVRVHPEFSADLFIAAEDKSGGYALLASLPVNYEVVEKEGAPQRLAVCVLRAVGFLSRRKNEMFTRPTMAGPDTTVPGAQLLGREIRMEFAVRPFSPAESQGVLRCAALGRAIPFHGQLLPGAPAWDGARAMSPLESDNGQLLVSAFKVSHNRRCLILRLFNPTDSAQTAHLKVLGTQSLTPCLLNERADRSAKPLRRAKQKIRVEVPPFGLRSYMFSPNAPVGPRDYEYGWTGNAGKE